MAGQKSPFSKYGKSLVQEPKDKEVALIKSSSKQYK